MVCQIAIPSIAGIGVFLLAHIVWWRVFPSSNPRILLLAALAVLGIAVAALTSISFFDFSLLALFAAVCVDCSLVIFYLFFYAGIARSVSVTLLSRLLDAEEQVLDFDALVKEYSLSSRFEDRIDLMHQSGLVRVTGVEVSITDKGGLLGTWARRLGRLIGEGLEG